MRARSSASSIVCGPAAGLPSWSPPIHVPKRNGVGAPGIRAAEVRGREPGAASSRLCSKNQRPCRISSTTRGPLRAEPRPSARGAVTSSAIAASTPSRAERGSAGSSSSSSSPLSRTCAARTVRRVASVGCAVRTSSSERRRAAGRGARRPTPPRSSCANASSSDSRGRLLLVLVLAPPAQPVMLLGQVRELEVEGERAEHFGLPLEREGGDGRGELGPRRAASARARLSRERCGSARRRRAALDRAARPARARGRRRRGGRRVGAARRRQGRVTAPSLADETSAAYFASTPLS